MRLAWDKNLKIARTPRTKLGAPPKSIWWGKVSPDSQATMEKSRWTSFSPSDFGGQCDGWQCRGRGRFHNASHNVAG